MNGVMHLWTFLSRKRTPLNWINRILRSAVRMLLVTCVSGGLATRVGVVTAVMTFTLYIIIDGNVLSVLLRNANVSTNDTPGDSQDLVRQRTSLYSRQKDGPHVAAPVQDMEQGWGRYPASRVNSSRMSSLNLTTVSPIVQVPVKASGVDKSPFNCKKKGNDPSGLVELPRSLYHTPGLELYMHSAHYDTRFNSTIVRAFGIEYKDGVSKNFTCRWQNDDGSPIETWARKIRVDQRWPEITTHYAVEIDCNLLPGVTAHHVDFGPWGQDLRIQLPVKVFTKPQQKKTIAVCVKPVTGDLKADRVVEWFELFRLAGIRDFIIYNADAMGRTKFVFDYYVSIGLLELVSFPFILALLDHVDGPTMRGVERYGVYEQSFLVAMQDCMYTYQHKFEYLLFVDLDEVLLPSQDISIQNLAKSVHKEHPDAASYMFLTAWHFEELGDNGKSKNQTNFTGGSSSVTSSTNPISQSQASVTNNEVNRQTYMQNHAWATYPLDVQPKSIVYPPHTVTVNWHGAHDVPDVKHANERILDFETTGYLHHFRGPCASKFDEKTCDKMLVRTRLDKDLVRYKKSVTENVFKTLNVLQMNQKLKQ